MRRIVNVYMLHWPMFLLLGVSVFISADINYNSKGNTEYCNSSA